MLKERLLFKTQHVNDGANVKLHDGYFLEK